MTQKTWTLTDAQHNLDAAELKVTPADVGGAAQGYSVRKYRAVAGKSAGVDLVEIDNGAISCIVLPTRGMGLWKVWQGELELGWRSPVKGPIHPQWVNWADPSGLGWLDGFDEFLCRCGLESNGAPDFDEDGKLLYPLHGKVANLPAHFVELAIDSEAGQIELVGVVDETRFHFQQLRLRSTLRTKIGEPRLVIVDEVTNLSAKPAELQLLYHVNFGQPLLDPGAKIVAPARHVVPRDPHAAVHSATWHSLAPEQPGFKELVFFCDLVAEADGLTQVLLKNAHATAGASLHFRPQQLPCFTVWKNTPGGADGYVTGLEPGTNFPNARSFEKEQKRVVPLPPGGTVRFELAIAPHADAAAVAEAEAAIAKIQAGHEPKVFDAVQRGWSKE